MTKRASRIICSIVASLALAIAFFVLIMWVVGPKRQSNPIRYYSTIYVRAAIVYEGSIDVRYWVTDEAIHGAALSFIGDPVLLAHNKSDPYQRVGTIIDTAPRYDELLEYWFIEAILEIKDTRTINRIQQGLFNSLSISFRPIRVTCNADGKDMHKCVHAPGQAHWEKGQYIRPRGILHSFTGLEVSFINVPASEHARILEWSPSPLELSARN